MSKMDSSASDNEKWQNDPIFENDSGEISIFNAPIFDSAIFIISPGIIQKSIREIKQFKQECLNFLFASAVTIPSIIHDEDLIEFFEGYRKIAFDKGINTIEGLEHYIHGVTRILNPSRSNDIEKPRSKPLTLNANG